jgi:hypothetical protein
MKNIKTIRKFIIGAWLLLISSLQLFAAVNQHNFNAIFTRIPQPVNPANVNQSSCGAYYNGALTILPNLYVAKGSNYHGNGTPCTHNVQNVGTPRFHSEVALLQHLPGGLNGAVIYIKNSSNPPCSTPCGKIIFAGTLYERAETQEGMTCKDYLNDFCRQHNCTIYVRWPNGTLLFPGSIQVGVLVQIQMRLPPSFYGGPNRRILTSVGNPRV